MDLSSKNDAYKNYLDQAKSAFNEGDLQRAKPLFIKAAEITNQITLDIPANRPDLKNEYYQVTKKILDFVKTNCTEEIKQATIGNQNETKVSQKVEIKAKKPLDESLKELNDLIGLDSVKQQIDSWVKQIQIFKQREEMGLKNPTITYHMVFTGNPGTGKTTVARIIGDIYYSLGIVSKGTFKEVDRSDLVSNVVGGTEKKTNEVLEKAHGGVLFIDEAYSLYKKDDIDFGHEVIDRLVKAMEDDRADFVVIAAGYEEEMDDFVKSNPGLESRFKTFLNFEDYNPEQLLEIFISISKKSDYKVSEDAKEILLEYFEKMYENRDRSFANARTVRNIFENSVTKNCTRLAGNDSVTKEDVSTLIGVDIDLKSSLKCIKK